MTDNAIAVTLVTRNASQDALSDSDYIGIIDSLRGPLYGWSWQRIADETGYNSKAWWALVSKGERSLNDEARNALRRITDGELPEQPPSVQAVVERMVDVDAAMYLIGTLEPGERVKRVLMLADGDVAVYANGDVVAKPLQAVLSGFDDKDNETHTVADVTPVTDAQRPTGENRRVPLRRYYRPALPTETRLRVEGSGKSLLELIDIALEVLHG